MPRIPRTDEEKIREYTLNYPELSGTFDNKLYCNVCYSIVNFTKKDYVLQHLKGIKHNEKAKRRKQGVKQSLVDFEEKDEIPFSELIAEAFIRADTPFHKIRHPSIQELFKRMNHTISSSEACRQIFTKIYNKRFSKLIKELKNENYVMVVDESQIKGAKVLLIKFANIKTPFRQNLVFCRKIESTCSDVIYAIIDSFIVVNGLDVDNFCLLCSDAASYILKLGEKLKEKYKNMYHITCFTHLIHNCAFKIKTFFKDVDALISSVKKLVIKYSDRQKLFETV